MVLESKSTTTVDLGPPLGRPERPSPGSRSLLIPGSRELYTFAGPWFQKNLADSDAVDYLFSLGAALHGEITGNYFLNWAD